MTDTSKDVDEKLDVESTDPEEKKIIDEMLKGIDDIKLDEEDDKEDKSKEKTTTTTPKKTPDIEVGSEMEKLLAEAVEATISRQDTKAKDDPELKFLALATLRFRHYDIKSATSRLGLFLELRRKYQVTNQKITDAKLRAFLDTGTMRILPKVDKGGRVIMVLNLAKHNPKNFATVDVIRGVHYLIMVALKRSPDIQKNGLIAIHDMKGVTHQNVDLQIPKELGPAFNKKFPVRMGGVYVVNPTAMARVLVPLYQRISPKLAKRIHIYGTKLEKLERNFEKDALLEELGGTLKFDYKEWIEDQAKK